MVPSDAGPGGGGGGTLVIPGRDKADFDDPELPVAWSERQSMTSPPAETREVRLNAGDVAIFVVAIRHGASKRTHQDEHRAVIYRYSPS